MIRVTDGGQQYPHMDWPKITTVNPMSPAGPALPDDEDPAVHAGHVNVLADELARLFGLVPLVVRQQAAEAALAVVNRHLRREHHDSGDR
jgi:hypothetical protein